MNDVLFHLCRHCVGIMDGWMPYPAWCIAQQCGVSISTARRRLTGGFSRRERRINDVPMDKAFFLQARMGNLPKDRTVC